MAGVDSLRIRSTLTKVFLGSALVSAALAVYLYLVWISGPSAASPAVAPFESFLLYVNHYDWVEAPYLQALRISSICLLLLALTQLVPRAARNPRVWMAGAVLVLSLQVFVFNVVVSDMTGTDWLYGVFLGMSWFEPWLVTTLASVSPGVYSTGGMAFVALMVSAVALFVVRRERGTLTAAVEALLFLSAVLFVFELGIEAFKPSWWEFQVTDFQFTIGLTWLTNEMLYALAAVSTCLLSALRVATWTLSRQAKVPRGTRVSGTRAEQQG